MKLQFAFALLALSTTTFATVRIHEELFIPGQNPAIVRDLVSTGSVEIDHVTSEGFELYGDKGLAKYLDSKNIPYIDFIIFLSKVCKTAELIERSLEIKLKNQHP